MRVAYRNDEDVARVHLESLLEQHRVEADSIPAAVRLIHARRLSRSMAGVAAIISAVVIALLAIHGLVSGQVRVFGNSNEPSILGPGGLTIGLLAAWLVVAAAYAAGRLLAEARLRTWLAPFIPSSGDVHADCARLAADAPRARLERLFNARERHSVALPLAGFMLLAPLTLHLGVYLLVCALIGHDIERPFEAYDSWICLSVVLVGHAHAVLAYLAFRFAGRLCEMESADLDSKPRPSGWGTLGITVVVSAIPGIILYLVPPILAAITGLLVVPWAFAAMRDRFLREQQILTA
jgi:hypothetical protein